MTALTCPGVLAVTGAAVLQEPATAAAESPLPGGIAAVVRFFFNLPSWFQIAGFILGVLVALAAAWQLWRRRTAIVTWVRTRPRNLRIGLAAAGAVALLLSVGSGAVSWNYMQHDNGFCTGCHVMGPAYDRFTRSEHSQLSCHDCHQQSIAASMRQMYLWVAERPAEIGPHAKVPNAVCSNCHVTGEKEVWQRIASTAGHRTHLESENPKLQGLQCVTCHGVEVHHFSPLDRTCAQSGCHEMSAIALGKMRDQTALHCTACHRFTAEVPVLATRDSAAGTLTPGGRQCFSCHAMQERLAGMNMDPARDPHGGTCGMCHNPHQQTEPAEARRTCTQAACHSDWRKVPFHVGAVHRGAVGQSGTSCTLCHLPHQARVDASNCAGCHESVRERTGRRPPLPFDTMRVRRGAGVSSRDDPDPVKGKGDAPPPDLFPSLPPAAAADTFSHDRHRSLACLTCHATSSPDARLTFEPPRGCQLCHHDVSRMASCAGCHTESERSHPESATVRVTVAGHAPRDRTVMFRHADHAAQSCVACHTTPVTLGVEQPAACASCHVPHHEGPPARNCAACHGPSQSGPAAAHAALSDFHVACDDCHAERIVALLTPDRTFCATCHGGREAHYADRQCSTCHFLAAPEEFRAHLRRDGLGG